MNDLFNKQNPMKDKDDVVVSIYDEEKRYKKEQDNNQEFAIKNLLKVKNEFEIDKDKINKLNTFYVLIFITALSSIIAIFKTKHYMVALFGIIYSALILHYSKKTKVNLNKDNNYYVYNTSILLREMLKNNRATFYLYKNSLRILTTFVLLYNLSLIIKLPIYIFQPIKTVSFIGVIMFTFINYIKEEYARLKAVLLVFYLFQCLLMLVESIKYGIINFEYVTNAFIFWFLANALNKLKFYKPTLSTKGGDKVE